MNKVKLPKEIAGLIEEAWKHRIEIPHLIKHLYLTNWTQLTKNHGAYLSETLSDYAERNPMEYMSALVNGYEVENTPEDDVRDYYLKNARYEKKTPYQEGVVAGVRTTLKRLGIKIEGINK